MSKLNKGITTYLRKMNFWDANKVANFLRLHKNKQHSVVYKWLVEYANRPHLFDVATKKVELVST